MCGSIHAGWLVTFDDISGGEEEEEAREVQGQVTIYIESSYFFRVLLFFWGRQFQSDFVQCWEALFQVVSAGHLS